MTGSLDILILQDHPEEGDPVEAALTEAPESYEVQRVTGDEGFLEEDYGDQLPRQARDDLENIKAASREMKRLIQHLLTISRVESRGAKFVPTSSEECARQALRTLKESLEACDAEVCLEAPLPTVLADPLQATSGPSPARAREAPSTSCSRLWGSGAET
ncbi:MAG: hypothetical protein J7M08_00865 [Planctomycetes bacterium]|nr:hypothetical protein [Planctomycetota bacterium]